jgi:hypothetical protein
VYGVDNSLNQQLLVMGINSMASGGEFSTALSTAIASPMSWIPKAHQSLVRVPKFGTICLHS